MVQRLPKRRPKKEEGGDPRDGGHAKTPDAPRGQYEDSDLDVSGHGAESYQGSPGFDDAQPSGQYGGDGDAK